MTASNWLCLDELRESWVFLILDEITNRSTEKQSVEDDREMQFWEIGVGNSNSLVSTDAERIDSENISSESDLITALLVELDQYRHQDAVLITPTQQAIRHLRRQLVGVPEEGSPSLRGFSHVSLADVLDDNFDQTLQDYDFDQSSRTPPRLSESDATKVVSTGAAEEFWTLWTQIFRLLPPSALQGRKL